MKSLLCCPMVNNAHICAQLLNSIVNQRQDIAILVNGMDKEVIELVVNYQANYPSIKYVIWEPENIFVTAAWNKFLELFLSNTKYTHILILNSDLIVNHDFFKVLEEWVQYSPTSIPIPKTVDKIKIFNRINPITLNHYTVTQGVAGICIILHRKAAACAYPIPEDIKVWYNDDYIMKICQANGYKLCILEDLKVFHEGSQTVKTVEGIMDIIEKDKIVWRDKVLPELEERIKKLKETNEK